MKMLKWAVDNILFVFTLFLLAFVPLYPKLPLLDIRNTWVYIRLEDFVVVFVLVVWTVFLLRKKITLRTPLTLPIMFFWIVGAVATIHGVLLIFPGVANVFPNVAFLSYLRRIEYLSLFFVAFSGMKDKRFLPYVIAVLTVTMLLVIGYGIGQKYFGFYAYLTMNEEFAKGLAIQLSPLSRVASTFGGHYDLAAYLVLLIPILASLIFGVRNWFIRLVLFGTVSLGFVLLFMTVSRVSFFVLLIALSMLLLFQKKRWVIFSLPVAFIIAILFLTFSTTLLERFGSTIKEIDVLVDAKTGEAIGHPKEVSSTYFENKVIMQDYVFQKLSKPGLATPSAKLATPSGIIDYRELPPKVLLLVATDTSTGESLPQGTGYINLVLSPVTKKLGEYFYEKTRSIDATKSADVLIIHGDFLIKKALAYDRSFTTRFQGEWPHALEALKRNIFIGSGYSSISLAVDNNYLRILGEIGLLGFASFLALFITIGIYIRKILPEVDSPLVRRFILGFVAGVVGLSLNAIFIDVFEASKIAFLLWLLTGVVLGILHLYQTKPIDLPYEFKKIFTSPYAIIVYIFIASVVVFSPMVDNFFVGDDFTWFRWVGQDSSIAHYFTHADGFFYRPGTKVYFLLMYKLFWLNQTAYHAVSIFLHFIVAALLFLLAKRVVRVSLFSALASLLFLMLSGYSEAVFWISSTGFLFTTVFALSSVLFFVLWEEKKTNFYFILTLLSIIFGLLFHELGIVIPLFLLLYKFVREETFTFEIFKKFQYVFLFLPILPYLTLRFLAQSHWLSGDYNYNLIKLPFNIAGNTIGYFLLILFGPISLSFYQVIRNLLRENIGIASVASIIVSYFLFLGFRFAKKRLDKEERRIIIFGLSFFFIALLPFMGLGNITSRYSYLASCGVILLVVFFIKKLYDYLQDQGKDIALAAVTATVALFCLSHIIQVQQIHSDWYEAGEKVRRFFVAIDGAYDDYWATEPMKFYFVNVPIRHQEAWVFPVGLSDALWLVFRNPDISVYTRPSRQQALDAVTYGDKNEKVFEFDESGRLIERKKVLKVQ